MKNFVENEKINILEPLKLFCEKYDILWNSHTETQFGRYLALLEHHRKSANLIGPMPPETIIRELFLDSIICASQIKIHGKLLDVGTGAGLPGLPLKFLYPELELTLVEPRNKRVVFLQTVKKELALKNTYIMKNRVESLPKGRFDIVISKAFAPPVKWIEIAKPFCKPESGRILCMTRKKYAPELLTHASKLGLKHTAEIEAAYTTIKGFEDRAVFAFKRPFLNHHD